MASAPTLVQSSTATQSWLNSLRARLPELQYSEAKYYAAFKTGSPSSPAAYLNPSKRSVRLFLALDPDPEAGLNKTPSTSSWAERFPSVFSVKDEQDLSRAADLILLSSSAIQASASTKARDRRGPAHLAAEELLSDAGYVEGSVVRTFVNRYERNRKAREACLRHYGNNCAACGFNFEAHYGSEMAGYIHVHHIIPIANIGKQYRLDPVNDLRPVCANCHAVIHRREPAFSLEDVKRMLLTRRSV